VLVEVGVTGVLERPQLHVAFRLFGFTLRKDLLARLLVGG
jgi:hypothetical protein